MVDLKELLRRKKEASNLVIISFAGQSEATMEEAYRIRSSEARKAERDAAAAVQAAKVRSNAAIHNERQYTSRQMAESKLMCM